MNQLFVSLLNNIKNLKCIYKIKRKRKKGSNLFMKKFKKINKVIEICKNKLKRSSDKIKIGV